MTKFSVEDYVRDYEFRGEGGDYKPTEAEQEMLVDAIHGAIWHLENPAQPQRFPWEGSNTYALRRRKQPIGEWLFRLLDEAPKNRILVYTVEYDEAHLNVRIEGVHVAAVKTNSRDGLSLLRRHSPVKRDAP